MRLGPTLIALSLVASTSAGQYAKPAPKPADPMASFARLVSDEWTVTAQSGTSMFHTWHWGPGQHSIRRMTDGAGADSKPWREVMVYYRHPGRKEVRVLGVSPVARGVSEGTISFEGDKAGGVFDLHQERGLRKMSLRWAFDGPDKFRDTLLEASGRDGYQPLVELEHVRTKPPAKPRPWAVDGEKPSERLKALEPLLGHSREAAGEWVDGGAFSGRSTFEWVPIADAVYVRVVVPGKGGDHLLDAYLYHHTGAKELRCLALTSTGGVYKGDIKVLEGGALELDLKGYEGDREGRCVVRLDFEKDGTVRQRVWSVKGKDRSLTLDVHHKKVEPKKE